ncbi:hypothetical protein C0J52_19257 [Blattella germanica]|nr:hypothetical protein C0J52_19257 [Blattella germanica]
MSCLNLHYKCSMCAPLVTRQISRRYSSSVQTRASMFLFMESTAALILCLRSFMSAGNGGTYTKSLLYPHKKKMQGVMSGDRGGHGTLVNFLLRDRSNGEVDSHPGTHEHHCEKVVEFHPAGTQSLAHLPQFEALTIQLTWRVRNDR